jgi:hypothetical protein
MRARRAGGEKRHTARIAVHRYQRALLWPVDHLRFRICHWEGCKSSVAAMRGLVS